MSKQVIERIVPQIRYTTQLPIQEVLRRLDAAINRAQGEGGKILELLASDAWQTGNRAAAEAQVQRLMGRSFGFFGELPHSAWLRRYLDQADLPETHVYTLGNPLFASEILRHGLHAGLYVPPRVAVVAEKGGATTVVYDLLAALVGGGEEQRRAAEEVDRKLEELVREVTGVHDEA
ncbi:hypothetical protein K488DRAFT_83941 [Vararia minispora EC-137]|uniref:Uncharacterized protein n=1 Tax=Vararia minispora EC-137 TaxID=1314806 RepID=A0ACB8QS76_9AGAM|nr:hypothetical protein K488DRAFT_83941 [Vararia minispora EC-137]